MNKAFLFDMDGVIIDSESVWEKYEQQFFPKMMGKSMYLKIKDKMLGNAINNIYEIAKKEGFRMCKNTFLREYHRYSKLVYRESKITKGIRKLMDNLILKGYKLGLVSVSRQDWIDLVIKRLGKNDFQCILSLDSLGIRSKPYPDGYINAMKLLNTNPKNTIILEDSQKGIDAAKASKAFAVCLTEHLPKSYVPIGADRYYKSVTELLNSGIF